MHNGDVMVAIPWLVSLCLCAIWAVRLRYNRRDGVREIAHCLLLAFARERTWLLRLPLSGLLARQFNASIALFWICGAGFAIFCTSLLRWAFTSKNTVSTGGQGAASKPNGFGSQEAGKHNGKPRLRPLMFPSKVQHTRTFPKKHSFNYSYLMVGLPVGSREKFGSLLSVDLESHDAGEKEASPAWLDVRSADHLARGDDPDGLKGKLNAYLKSIVSFQILSYCNILTFLTGSRSSRI